MQEKLENANFIFPRILPCGHGLFCNLPFNSILSCFFYQITYSAGKSFAEAFILPATNSQYDKGLFMELL